MLRFDHQICEDFDFLTVLTARESSVQRGDLHDHHKERERSKINQLAYDMTKTKQTFSEVPYHWHYCQSTKHAEDSQRSPVLEDLSTFTTVLVASATGEVCGRIPRKANPAGSFHCHGKTHSPPAVRI